VFNRVSKCNNIIVNGMIGCGGDGVADTGVGAREKSSMNEMET